jgi:hypothetical protein
MISIWRGTQYMDWVQIEGATQGSDGVYMDVVAWQKLSKFMF